MATTVEYTGALDADGGVAHHEVLARRDARPGARIDAATRRYTLAAGALGTGTGLVSMITIAGIPPSVPLGAARTMALNCTRARPPRVSPWPARRSGTMMPST